SAPTPGITNTIAFYHPNTEEATGPGPGSDYRSLAQIATIVWSVITVLFLGYIVWKSKFAAIGWTPADVRGATIFAVFLVTSALLPLIFHDLKVKKADDERSFSVVRTAGTI